MIVVERKTIKGERKDILRTVDPVKAETHYFYLCKYYAIQDGNTIFIKSDNDDVPNAKYYCGSAWIHQRKEVDEDRFKMIWASPAEGWVTPSIYMLKGIKNIIKDNNNKPATAKWICGHLGKTRRAWGFWVSTGKIRKRIQFSDWNYIKLLAGLNF